ncbi:methyltransferase domain-containing protein [Pontiella sp.]|uniref:methyltransferase domain-containing protein n=1 Tax=Pontiella sp. TaxID=2837462 RepID=UPI0035637EC7
MLPDLSSRATVRELMDEPDCDEARLLRTVRQFSAINRLVGRYRTILRKTVLADMLNEPDREYHLVDMGAGGCDIDVWLLRAARKRGLKLRITACDIDERIIGYARSEYGDEPGLTIQNRDLLAGSAPASVDYVFANHFLHHLTDGQIVGLIRKWAPQVRRSMVFSDLHRLRSAYVGYAAFALFFPKSFARVDGLISIRRGFVPGDLTALAKQALPAGLFTVERYTPGRLVLGIDGSGRNP